MAGVNSLRRYLLILSLITVIIAVAAMYFLGNRISKPIINLSQKIDEFGEGNLTVEFEQETEDEVGQMASSLQNMANNLRNMIRDS